MVSRYFAFVILFLTLSAIAQPPAKEVDSTDLLEFPVVMMQNVAVGKTAVGTNVQAKLMVATLVKGVVVPKDAIFSGVVEQSSVKSDSTPARLAIRMDSVRWKTDSLNLKLYLTNWYYPPKRDIDDSDSSGPSGLHGEVAVVFGGGRTVYPPGSRPDDGSLPGRNPGDLPDPPASATSAHRVQMDGVTSTRNGDGQIVISSDRRNIKLDKSTTYVLGTSNLVPAK